MPGIQKDSLLTQLCVAEVGPCSSHFLFIVWVHHHFLWGTATSLSFHGNQTKNSSVLQLVCVGRVGVRKRRGFPLNFLLICLVCLRYRLPPISESLFLNIPCGDWIRENIVKLEEKDYLSPGAAAAWWCVQHGMQLPCCAIYCLH